MTLRILGPSFVDKPITEGLRALRWRPTGEEFPKCRYAKKERPTFCQDWDTIFGIALPACVFLSCLLALNAFQVRRGNMDLQRLQRIRFLEQQVRNLENENSALKQRNSELEQCLSASPVHQLVSIPPLNQLAHQSPLKFVSFKSSHGKRPLYSSPIPSGPSIPPDQRVSDDVDKRLKKPHRPTMFESFLSRIATANLWQAERNGIGLRSATDNHSMISLLLNRAVPGDGLLRHRAELPKDVTDLLALTTNYVYGIKGDLHRAEFYKRVAPFKILISMGLILLLRKKVSIDKVCPIVNDLIGKRGEMSWQTAKRYLQGALWVFAQASALHKAGWGNRSWEIFLLCE